MSLHRQVEITVPPERTDALIARIRSIDGVLGIQVQRSGSVHPPGDVVTVQTSNHALHPLIRVLSAEGVGGTPASSISTAHLASLVSPDATKGIGTEPSESTWEEIELEIGKQSNMTVNGVSVMAISGVLAVVGIATDAIHLVIGAMVIAPGFAPITRIALGLVGRGHGWRRGVAHTAIGYLAVAVAAAAATIALRMLGTDPLGGKGEYLAGGTLLAYWSSVTAPSLLASAVGATGGAVLIATNRGVLTAGVMIALALIPTAAITGIAAVSGEPSLLGRGALRWAIDAALVLVCAVAVFAWKRRSVHQRDMLG